MSIDKYLIKETSLIRDALIKIDNNKKSFLVVCDRNKHVIGITTEGDIRRGLINGLNISSKIPFSKDFTYVNNNEPFSNLFSYFKLEKINFIPILNDKNELVNLISKKQFHGMLLKDIEYNIKLLPEIGENEIDYEIYERPWGFYKSTLLADHVQSKIITVFPKGELSLQKHKRREEHWIIIKGEGKIFLEDSILDVEQGRYIYIPKGCKHKVVNSSENENLIFAEVQLGDYFGEDDIIRYEDKYGRI